MGQIVKAILALAIYMSTIPTYSAQNDSIMKAVNNNAPVFSTKTILINAKPEQVWTVLT